jgi:hypothetical protein
VLDRRRARGQKTKTARVGGSFTAMLFLVLVVLVVGLFLRPRQEQHLESVPSSHILWF